MDVFLDIAMNGNLDRLMTIWGRMFHPFICVMCICRLRTVASR